MFEPREVSIQKVLVVPVAHGFPDESNCGYANRRRRRAIVAPLVPGESGCQSLKWIRDNLAQECFGVVVADGTLRAELLGHVIQRFQNRLVGSALADVGHLEQHLPRELPLDAGAEAPELRIDAVGRPDVAGSVSKIGQEALRRTDRLHEPIARHRVAQVGLEGQPVVAADRNWRVP
jgi:hypothetical protein